VLERESREVSIEKGAEAIPVKKTAKTGRKPTLHAKTTAHTRKQSLAMSSVYLAAMVQLGDAATKQ
jgi:hypothetical protein